MSAKALLPQARAYWQTATMKRAEVQLPDALYHQIEGLAARLRMSVPELLSVAAEQMVLHHDKRQPKPGDGWRFPEGSQRQPENAVILAI